MIIYFRFSFSSSSVMYELHHCSIEVGHAHALDDTPRPNHCCCMRKHGQVMQVAAVQEHEEVAAQRHVDLSQWQRGEVILHLISAPQAASWSTCLHQSLHH